MRKTILAVATLAGLAAIQINLPMNANAQSSTVGGALIGVDARVHAPGLDHLADRVDVGRGRVPGDRVVSLHVSFPPIQV